MDYEGITVPRAAVAPGASHLERSFASHPWIVVAATSDAATQEPFVG